MNNWRVNIQTHSRDDILKVCSLLGRGIGKNNATSQRSQIKIFGSFKSGKSVIVDGLTAALSDNLTCYGLSRKPLYEIFPAHAKGKRLVMDFICSQRPILNSLYHEEYDFFRIKKSNRQIALDIKDEPGLDFETYVGSVIPNLNALSIKFKQMDCASWHRSWQIKVNAEHLRTKEMATVLDHLRNFHDRRQARLKVQEDVTMVLSRE